MTSEEYDFKSSEVVLYKSNIILYTKLKKFFLEHLHIFEYNCMLNKYKNIRKSDV